MQTTQNHWIECPSRLCQEAILLACQLSRPGKTSLYNGILACIIRATPFPCDNDSPIAVKLRPWASLWCFPLTFVDLTLPFLAARTSSPLLFEAIPTTFIRMVSQMGLLTLVRSEGSSTPVTSSESAIKLFKVSTVISAADSAACSRRNYIEASDYDREVNKMSGEISLSD